MLASAQQMSERSVGEREAKNAKLAQTAGAWQACSKHASRALNAGIEIDNTATPLAWYKGIALQHSGQTTKALEILLEAVERNPYHITLLSDIGGCYAMLGNRAKSIEYYERALSVTPCFPDAIRNLSVVYLQSNRTADACTVLEGQCLRERMHLPEYQEVINAVFQQRLLEWQREGRFLSIQPDQVFEHFKASVAGNCSFEAQLTLYLDEHD